MYEHSGLVLGADDNLTPATRCELSSTDAGRSHGMLAVCRGFGGVMQLGNSNDSTSSCWHDLAEVGYTAELSLPLAKKNA